MVRKMSIQRSNPVRVSWHMRQMLAMAAPSLLVSTANDRWQSRFIPPTPMSPKSLSLFTKFSNPKTALMTVGNLDSFHRHQCHQNHFHFSPNCQIQRLRCQNMIFDTSSSKQASHSLATLASRLILWKCKLANTTDAIINFNGFVLFNGCTYYHALVPYDDVNITGQFCDEVVT